jgi:signal transduction histidine kinase
MRDRHEYEARKCLGSPSLWQDQDDDEVPSRFAAGTREIEKLPDIDPREEAVAQIVHDLKNPLSTIRLEAYLLDDKLARGERDDARATLARIQHNISFLDRMVHDILDSCSIEAGKLELHRAPTDIRILLEQVVDRAVPTRDRPRVFLETDGTATLAIDDLRIERVVANLIANALKYAPACTGIVVRLEINPGGVRVSVIDAGTSMTPAEMSVVFEKYRRGHATSSHDGSGLGLYVSREIVEAHGGRIDVECARGIGTRFFFDLPW